MLSELPITVAERLNDFKVQDTNLQSFCGFIKSLNIV